jgi:mRNA interferase MazF
VVKPPERGQVIKLNFNPKLGSEQAGYRPAVVLSRTVYNAKTGMMLACPITSSKKGYATEIALPKGLKTKGVILSTQIKAMDWRERPFRVVESVEDEILEAVLDRLIAVIE